ncbi:MAG: ATP-binding protein [Nitrososphaerales archaeon]|nr:ATP-binding protein [Nitrososphaerales archaeon]
MSEKRRGNPFEPGKPVDPEYFGGRKRELETFREYLGYSIEGNIHNLALMGERGIGKSSLLRKFEQIASEEYGCLVIRREMDASVDSLRSLTMFMLEAAKSEGSSRLVSRKRKAAEKVTRFFERYKVGISVMGQGVSIERLERTAAVQDYFYSELMHIWEGIREGTRGVVFLIDEAERLQGVEGSWSFLRSVLTRTSEEDAGYMLVVSGKLGLFRGIKEIFSPMGRFFTPLEVAPMKQDEVRDVLEKPLKERSIGIASEAARMVSEYSGGHPYIVQTFGLFAFAEAVDSPTKTVDAPMIQKVLPKVMTRLAGQVFRDRFEDASPLERRVLLAIAKGREDEVAPQDISALMEDGERNTAIRPALKRLVEKDCLVKKERGTYSFFTPLFGEYVKARMTST